MNRPLLKLAARFAHASVLVLILILTAGCGISMKFGKMPNTAPLGALQRGSSTKADVLATIGTPRGGGRSQFPIEHKPRELWWYYYEEATLKDAHRIFLFIFFDQGRYDGHLWFSTLPQIQPASTEDYKP